MSKSPMFPNIATTPLERRFPRIIAMLHNRGWSHSEALFVLHGALQNAPRYREGLLDTLRTIRAGA
jgi:hypothetical protein